VTPEGKIKAHVKRALTYYFGAKCYSFMPVQQGLGASTLDYLLCVKGLFVSIETKAPGKHLTPRQEIVKAAIEAAGGVVFVVDSDATLDAAIEGIKRQLKLVYMREYNKTHGA